MTSQHGAYEFMHDKQSYIHMPTLPNTHTHAHTHTHTHRPISNTCCFSTATMICESASLLRYTYIVCLVSHIFFYFHSGMSISKVGKIALGDDLTFGRPELLIYNFFFVSRFFVVHVCFMPVFLALLFSPSFCILRC